MKTNVTDKLREEHKLILEYIDTLENYLAAVEDSPEWEDLFQGLLDFVDFIRTYADKYHHAKEEDILFRYLDQPGVLSHCNPLPVMLNDHEEGRAYISALIKAIRDGDRKSAVYNARSWAGLLQDHINKEDQVLYIMAEDGLGESAREEILQEYSLAESRHDGPRLESRYREKLHQLKRILDFSPSKKYTVTH